MKKTKEKSKHVKRNYLVLFIYIVSIFLTIYGLFGWLMAAEQPWCALFGLILLTIVRSEELHGGKKDVDH
jgi:hypothetical protein